MKGVVLSAGKADPSICQVYGNIPTALIPIYGKPIIFYILQNCLQLGLKEVYITVGFEGDKVKRFVDKFFKSAALKIHFVPVDEQKKPGNSLFAALKEIEKGKVFISLADTICSVTKDDLADGNIIMASKNFDRAELWCTVTKDQDGTLMHIRDKERHLSKNELALTGIYLLENCEIISELEAENMPENFEISHLLATYHKKAPIQVKETDQWLDFGHIEKYQRSKKRLLEARSFNHLSFNDVLGTLTKKSTYTHKFVAEIEWLLNLPKSLKVLSPRVLDYSLDRENSYVTMEYYSYQTMTEIWLFSNFNKRVLKSIVDKLLDILYLFETEKRTVRKEDYQKVYLQKTTDRVALIDTTKVPALRHLLEGNDQGLVCINDVYYKSWGRLQEDILQFADEQLFNEAHNCLIHGDYCFSNLLYDINSGVVRLIDPRGIWGSSAAGDIKYDLAKLRHSISGDYDFIVNDLFSLDINEKEINYTIENNENQQRIKKYFDKKLAKRFDLAHIKLIEGLLFLSMIPLHDNAPRRQVVLLSKAIEKLNTFADE